MPRYFFHLRKNGRASDETGVELAGPEAARVEASRCLAEEMKDDPKGLWDDEEWYVDVADESGLILFSVFSAAIETAATQAEHAWDPLRSPPSGR